MTSAASRGVRHRPSASLPALSTREFNLFRTLIRDLSGIHLSDAKASLLLSRLGKRVRDLGLGSFSAYYRHVVDDGNAAERILMLDRVVTNETRFFREPRQFAFLDEVLVPVWRRPSWIATHGRRLRVWCAGCSTGQEAYSVAMALLTHFPAPSGWQIDILGTDLSTRALAVADAGVWPIEKAAEIPQRYLRRFMRRGVGARAGDMRATSEVRSVLTFYRSSLHDAAYPFGGRFDLIFCRNVLIYFDQTTQASTVERLITHLHPEGHLFVGHAESLKNVTDRVRPVAPTIYVHADARGEA